MFGRKKNKEEVVLPQQPIVQADYAPGEDIVYGYPRDARPRKVKAIYAKVPGITPVAKPADFVQLTPVVTPITIVPYMSSEQPVFTYSQDEDEE